jgi:opacity protein-like surface antigen
MVFALNINQVRTMNLTKWIPTLATALVLGIGLPSAPSAYAQWYISGDGGAAIQRDAFTTNTEVIGSISGELEFDTGSVVNGAVGYSLGAIRLEGAISYQKNDLDTWNVTSVTLGGTTFSGIAVPLTMKGDISTLGFMINGWYDFDTGTKWVPFIGGGVGIAKVNIDVESILGVATTYDESDTVLAYQFGAGIGYKLTPTVTANLSYRYFGTGDLEFDDGTDKLDSEYKSSNFMAGISVRF